MAGEASSSTTTEVKQTSDGQVKIAVEKYNDLLETIAAQKGSINDLRGRLQKAVDEPPIIHRTVVNKTAEMVAEERRVWGGSLMGLGATLFVVGGFLYRSGRA